LQYLSVEITTAVLAAAHFMAKLTHASAADLTGIDWHGRYLRKTLILGCFSMGANSAAHAQMSSWEIDRYQSQASFQVRYLLVGSVKGSMKNVTGTVDWDPSDVSKCSVTAILDTTTIQTGKRSSERGCQEFHFFDSDTFPTLTFRPTSVTKALAATSWLRN